MKINKPVRAFIKNKVTGNGCSFILFFVFFCLSSIANHSFAQSASCESVTITSPAKAVVGAFQEGDCLQEVSDIDSAKKLVQMMNLDVINYFDLGNMYDTDAKQNEYKQTKAYKESLDSLTAWKKEKLNSIFYAVLTKNLGRFSWAIKGYKFDMDNLTTPGGTKGLPPPPRTMFYDIDLSSLPFEVSKSGDQDMAILVDPDTSMDIDRNNKDSLMILVLFKLGNVTSKEYSYLNEQCHCNRNAKEEVITTKFDRVLIFNIRTNEIYWDVFYDKASLK